MAEFQIKKLWVHSRAATVSGRAADRRLFSLSAGVSRGYRAFVVLAARFPQRLVRRRRVDRPVFAGFTSAAGYSKVTYRLHGVRREGDADGGAQTGRVDTSGATGSRAAR